jgi:hypothetical protein
VGARARMHVWKRVCVSVRAITACWSTLSTPEYGPPHMLLELVGPHEHCARKRRVPHRAVLRLARAHVRQHSISAPNMGTQKGWRHRSKGARQGARDGRTSSAIASQP